MPSSPYVALPAQAFWRQCRDDPRFLIDAIYTPKFGLAPGTRIATAGSCFAQNIGRYIRESDFELVDVEPAPRNMPTDVATRFGYGLFSARYGNIYTPRQLAQLLRDALDETVHDCAIWESEGRFFDGLRPNTEPEGLASGDEVRAFRLDHLRRVRQMVEESDVLIFTLGLTEAWMHRETGVVFPTAPGTVAGQYDPALHAFANFTFSETHEDLGQAITLLRQIAPGLRIILTVSPVPLTATASGQHVLRATSYSKSVLRAVAEEASRHDDRIDYFPSYEIITGLPFGNRFYKDNLRNVTRDGVENVMAVFFGAQPGGGNPVGLGATGSLAPDRDDVSEDEGADEVVCEEAMLEAFGRS
ncbi:MAG TPA: GSCFA family protein [Rhodobacterales bacterium]|nr:GSCFA family protein [Rhodobacterales bacterium]